MASTTTRQSPLRTITNARDILADAVLGMVYHAAGADGLEKHSLDRHLFENLVNDVVDRVRDDEVLKEKIAEGKVDAMKVSAMMVSVLLDDYIEIAEATASRFPAGSDEELLYTTLKMALGGKKNAIVLNGSMAGLEERTKGAFACALMVHHAMQMTDVVSAFHYVAEVSSKLDGKLAALAGQRLSFMLDSMEWDVADIPGRGITPRKEKRPYMDMYS